MWQVYVHRHPKRPGLWALPPKRTVLGASSQATQTTADNVETVVVYKNVWKQNLPEQHVYNWII